MLVLAITLPLAGPPRTNPDVAPGLALDRQAAIPSTVDRVLRHACYDCHSHETRWPWYSRLAPGSWLVVADVNEGRQHMNFSMWGDYHRFERADLLDKSCELASNGTMPLEVYRWMHAEARLTPGDVEALCNWTRHEADRLASSEGR